MVRYKLKIKELTGIIKNNLEMICNYIFKVWLNRIFYSIRRNINKFDIHSFMSMWNIIVYVSIYKLFC